MSSLATRFMTDMTTQINLRVPHYISLMNPYEQPGTQPAPRAQQDASGSRSGSGSGSDRESGL
jgi:hypothetical protein